MDSNSKNDFEKVRIYWTTLIPNIYEKLKEPGRVLIQQYLKSKPWSDQPITSAKSTPLSFTDFTKLIAEMAFDTNGLYHVQELGEHMRTIYSYPMNRVPGRALTLPVPPGKVKAPKSTDTFTDERDRLRELIEKLSLKDMAYLCLRADDIFSDEKHSPFQFMTAEDFIEWMYTFSEEELKFIADIVNEIYERESTN